MGCRCCHVIDNIPTERKVEKGFVKGCGNFVFQVFQ
jgi:hypothetical protein